MPLGTTHGTTDNSVLANQGGDEVTARLEESETSRTMVESGLLSSPMQKFGGSDTPLGTTHGNTDNPVLTSQQGDGSTICAGHEVTALGASPEMVHPDFRDDGLEAEDSDKEDAEPGVPVNAEPPSNAEAGEIDPEADLEGTDDEDEAAEMDAMSEEEKGFVVKDVDEDEEDEE